MMSTGSNANSDLAIEIFRLTKRFKHERQEVVVFDDFTLDVNRGEVISILGASGCGKTTLLNMVSRVEPYDSGRINIEPDARIGYMFQNALLLPWRDAEKNALLGVEIIGNDHDEEHHEKLSGYFQKLGMEKFKKHYPDQLSGGMRQRVALIRTLLFDPHILLLDEPFSALDYISKLSLESEVLEFAREKERTVLFVTHDIDEAIAVGSHLIVLQGEPAANCPSRVTLQTEITFSGDVSGRNPVTARQDPKFSEYFTCVFDALKHQ